MSFQLYQWILVISKWYLINYIFIFPWGTHTLFPQISYSYMLNWTFLIKIFPSCHLYIPHDSQFTIIKSLVYIFPPKASAFTILSKVQISLNWKYLYMESWSGTQWDMSTSNQWSHETCPVEHDNTHDGTYLIMFVWCLHADIRIKLKCRWS